MKTNNLLMDGNKVLYCKENLEKMSIFDIMMEFHTYEKLKKPNLTGIMVAFVTILCVPIWVVTFIFQPLILSIFDKLKRSK